MPAKRPIGGEQLVKMTDIALTGLGVLSVVACAIEMFALRDPIGAWVDVVMCIALLSLIALRRSHHRTVMEVKRESDEMIRKAEETRQRTEAALARLTMIGDQAEAALRDLTDL